MLTIFMCTQDWSDDFRDSNGYPTLGGSGHTRLGLPAKYLAQNGHDVKIGRIVINADNDEIGCQTWDGENHFGADIVVLQHLMHKDLPEAIKRSRVTGTVVLCDVDDDYWSLSPSNRAWWVTHPRKSEDVNINHFYKVIAEADGITVSTPALKKRLERAGKKVFLLRNAIDVEDWNVNGRRNKEPVIGWVGSTQTRSGDIEILMGILEQFCEKHSLQVFHGGDLEGANSFASLANLDEKRIKTAPMTSVSDYPNLFKHFDIGVVPLSKAPFNDSKSFLRGLEYTAAGIPWVASDSPEYHWLRTEHGMGFLASRPHDWLYHLKNLLSLSYRESVMEAWRVQLKDFDMANRWEDWKQAYWNALMHS